MRKSAIVWWCACVLVLAAPALAAMPIQLPTLTRIASEMTGLKAKRAPKLVVLAGAPIEARAVKLLDRDYPRDQQAYDETLYRALGLLGPAEPLRPILLSQLKGVQGLYDPFSATLWARQGPALQKTVVHELVHALQDQTFDLRRVASLRRGSRDAASASAAAAEGSATFFSDVLGGARVPATRAPQITFEGTRARFFVQLLNAFPYTTGLRFAAGLQNVGGRPAVYSSLRRLPETTEQIFHLDAFLARERPLPVELPSNVGGFTLLRDDTFGELDVRALLAVFGVPRLDRTGTGWGAGLSALYRTASGERVVALRLDWDTDLDARQWQESVVSYVNEAFDADEPGPPATVPCAADLCWSLPATKVAFGRKGAQTALVFSATQEAGASLVNLLKGG
jgi:hypothetical protein